MDLSTTEAAPGGHMNPERVNQYLLLLELAADLVSPEGYGHAVPLEVRLRTSRILSMGRKPPEGVGYTAPPPPRCEKCDSE